MVLKLNKNSNFGLDISPANRQAVFQHACLSGNPAYLVETDIMNASGLNQALGHSDANAVMRLGWALQAVELERLNPDILYIGKPNGDETTTIISGDIDAQALQAALDKAQSKFDSFLEEAGLSHLAHARADRLAGVQNVSAFVSIQNEDPSDNRLEVLVSYLHKEPIATLKRQSTRGEAAVSIENFRTNSYAGAFSKAVNNPQWGDIGMPTYIIPDDIEAPNDAGLQKAGIMQSRYNRKKHYEAIRHTDQQDNGSILRFDIRNLHNLNTDIGREGADLIINEIHRIIDSEVSKYDPNFRSFETESRQLDVFANVTGDDVTKLQLEIYETISGLNMPEGVDAVPIMMTSAPIKSDCTYDVALQRLEDQLSINQLHGVSLFCEHEKSIYCLGFDAEVFDSFPDLDFQSDASIPFARSATTLFDRAKMKTVFSMRTGEVMRFIHGDDYEGILRRHEIVKDLTENGVVDRDSVIAQLQQSSKMEDLDEWLEEKTGVKLSAHNSSGITDAERKITNNVEISSGEMGGRWIPRLLGISKDDYTHIKEICMQGQASVRMGMDLDKASSEFAGDPQTAKSLLLDDIQTRMSSIPNEDSRRIQSAEQAIRALHFIAALKGEDMPESHKMVGRVLTGYTFYDVGRNFYDMGTPYNSIASSFVEEAHDIQSRHGLSFENVERSISYLTRALSNEVQSVSYMFDGQERDKLHDNMCAIIRGLLSDTTPDHVLTEKLDL